MKNKLVVIGLIIIFFFLYLGIFASYLAPNNPYKVHLTHKLEQPNAMFLLGTDQLGRCILSRLIYGTRITLLGSFMITFAVFGIGLAIGIIVGYLGGLADRILSIIVDIFLSFPDMVLALAIIGLLGINILNFFLALICTHWAGYARITKNMVWEIKNKDYVIAAKSLGASWLWIICKHLLPNIFPRLLVMAAMDVGKFTLAIAGFSFLGLGVQPPQAEWGAMLNDGKIYMQTNPGLMIFPGLLIVMLTTGFTLLAEGLRDVLDPRQY